MEVLASLVELVLKKQPAVKFNRGKVAAKRRDWSSNKNEKQHC